VAKIIACAGGHLGGCHCRYRGAVAGLFSIDFGLTYVETSQWGGLLVTLVVAMSGIVVSFPLGILLALGRRSKMPIVKMFCGHLHRVLARRAADHGAVHVIGDAAAVPARRVTFDKLLRALIGVALFSSAYMAEVMRGGLQAIPKGQYEAPRRWR
jgi:general L-amino acid transport system permease protein